jgi:glycosyltransferase involved in cell wall biosynthesis
LKLTHVFFNKPVRPKLHLSLPRNMSNSKKEIRVLHITQWYPTKEDPISGIFIKRHFQSLEPFCEQEIWHLEIDPYIKSDDIHEEKNYKRFRLKSWLPRWRVIEYQYAYNIKKLLKKHRVSQEFTHVNFYIAYPALTHYSIFRDLLPKNVWAMEAWSAYHFKFGLKKTNERIASVFKNDIGVIVVSKSLAQDIISYSGRKNKVHILPNVVDVNLFKPGQAERKDHLFMVALWKWPKQPLWPLQALVELKKVGIVRNLRIGGYGPLVENIKQFVIHHGLEKQVTFLGKLSPEQVADEMRTAAAFLIPTDYETFSVVVAEALCSGCPVIASNTGAIPELINEKNGILVNDNWSEAFMKFEQLKFEHNRIADEAAALFSLQNVGKLFFDLLQVSENSQR